MLEEQHVTVSIDGRLVTLPAGKTIFEAAEQANEDAERQVGIPRIDIPTICHLPPQAPAGVCRVCVVDLRRARAAEKEPTPPGKRLVPACAFPVADGMEVVTHGDTIAVARKTLVELLMADHPSPCAREKDTQDCELEQRAREFGARTGRYVLPDDARPAAARMKKPFDGWIADDQSHPNILVDHDACIVCDRCVRGCTDQAENYVIGRAGKGSHTVITFDDGHLMGDSSCVSCGECMMSCPTGALTNRRFKTVTWDGTWRSVTADEVLELRVDDEKGPSVDLFDGIAPRFLRKVMGDRGIGRNENAVIERTLKKGDLLCEFGKQGYTAFFVKSGSVEVSIPQPTAVRSVPGARSLLGRWMRREVVPDTSIRGSIPVDATVDLDPRDPVEVRGPGTLLGEMTCLNYYPRSATIRALETTKVIEMIRPILLLLTRSKRFGRHLDDVYKRHSLQQLRCTGPLEGVDPAFLDALRPSLTLERYKPGGVIFRQGDVSDAFFLVRVGFVKVTWTPEGGTETVLAYRGRGEFFGEIGLLDGRRRTATCSAADHVDVIRIPAKAFRELCARFPTVEERVRKAAKDRKDSYRTDVDVQAHNMRYEEMGRQGLMGAQSLLVLDLDRCTRCDLCTQACASAHDGVTRLVREGLRFDHYLIATSCRQCRDPLCMFGCPVGSIHRNDSLEIKIESWCIGCGVCADNCPYGNINMIELSGTERRAEPRDDASSRPKRAVTCDLCHNLAAEPSCVVACPHGAAIRVTDPKAFFGVDDPKGPLR